MIRHAAPLRGEQRAPKRHYDLVIVGGGLHGLATAYYLSRDHGMSDIAIIEKKYIGYGGAGRNTAIVRANQRTQENIPLYKEALELWPQLTRDLDYNLMFHQCGNLNLAHSEAALKAMRTHVTSAQFYGVNIRMVDKKECRDLVPLLDISPRPTFPVAGGMFHPQGGIVRHDAVVWGLARAAVKAGVHIFQQTEVTGLGTAQGRICHVDTDRGRIATPRVLNAAGAYAAGLSWRMLSQGLPISVLTIQAMVTQPLKPVLDHVVSSGAYHVYCNQTLKGEIATGAHMDPWPNYTTATTAAYIRHQAWALCDLMPGLASAKFMRSWAGLADMTPDMAPIIQGNAPVKGYFLDCGWGYFGFKSGAVTGKYLAAYIAEDRCPQILKPFSLSRFHNYRLMGETPSPVYYSPCN